MAKKKSKKYQHQGLASLFPNASRNVKKRPGRKTKRRTKMNVVPESTGGQAYASTSNTLVGTSSASVSTSIASLSDVQGINHNNGNLDQVSGFIFMCNTKTKFECYKYRVFGLPRGEIDIVKRIKRGATLFLFDTNLKILHGVYEATSGGDLGLEPAAFNGRFPSQVKFKIYKDCIPIFERDFKHAVGEINHGNKFRQELSSSQVKNLVSLFHPVNPIPIGLPDSAATSSQNGGMPQYLQSRVLVENLPPPIRQPDPRVSYLSQLLYCPALPLLDHQPVQLAPRSLYANNQIETHGVYPQPSTGLRHVVHQPAPHGTSNYYPADAHQPYPNIPLLSSQDPYRSSGVTHLIIQQSRADGHETGGHTSLLPREPEIGVQSGYVTVHSSQFLPPVVASHVPLQANSLVHHHTSLPPASVRRELPTSYQAYYLAPVNEAAMAYADPTPRQGPQTTSLPEANSGASYYSYGRRNSTHQ